MTDKEIELKNLKDKSKKQGSYISTFLSMGIIGSGLAYALHDEKIGLAILASGVIPMLIKPEVFSLNNGKIKELEEEIEKSHKQKTL